MSNVTSANDTIGKPIGLERSRTHSVNAETLTLQSPSSWDLPHELTLSIFAQFDDYTDLIRVGACNRNWQQIHSEKSLWEKMILQKFPHISKKLLQRLKNLKEIFRLNLDMQNGICIEAKEPLSLKKCLKPVNLIDHFSLFISKTGEIYQYNFNEQLFEKIFTAEISPLEKAVRGNSIDQLCLPLAKRAFALIDIVRPKRYSEPVFEMIKIWQYEVEQNDCRLQATFNVLGQQWDGGYAGGIGTLCHVSKQKEFILKSPNISWAFADKRMAQLVKTYMQMHSAHFIGNNHAITRIKNEFTLINLCNFETRLFKVLNFDVNFSAVLNNKYVLIVHSSNTLQIVDPENGWKCLAQQQLSASTHAYFKESIQPCENVIFLFSGRCAYCVTFLSTKNDLWISEIEIDSNAVQFAVEAQNGLIAEKDYLILMQQYNNLRAVLIYEEAKDWNCHSIDCKDTNLTEILLTSSRQLIIAYTHNKIAKITLIDLNQPLPSQLDPEQGILAPSRLLHMQEMKGCLFLTGQNEISVLNLT